MLFGMGDIPGNFWVLLPAMHFWNSWGEIGTLAIQLVGHIQGKHNTH